jgi:PhnB protein
MDQVPTYYNTVMPYLILKDAAKFREFTISVFNASEAYITKREDSSIMHGEITIGGSTIMYAEATQQWSIQTAGLYINVFDCDENYKKALEVGATSVMEPGDQSYGRSCGIKDPCGNTWWITSPLKA